MRAQDDQIGLLLGGKGNDAVRRVALEHLTRAVGQIGSGVFDQGLHALPGEFEQIGVDLEIRRREQAAVDRTTQIGGREAAGERLDHADKGELRPELPGHEAGVLGHGVGVPVKIHGCHNPADVLHWMPPLGKG